MLNATVFGNSCWSIQSDGTGGSRAQSEDCLNLDVYTKSFNNQSSSNKLLPVVAFIYGGGLTDGSSSSYPDLVTFVEKGDIVLVCMNYRLAAFGFLALPALSDADPRGLRFDTRFNVHLMLRVSLTRMVCLCLPHHTHTLTHTHAHT